jgi:ectoine hydroxylase-related dioxygenase (phytanoyl-CoA dioxygenase family)
MTAAESAASFVAQMNSQGWAATEPVVAPPLLERVAGELGPFTQERRGGIRNLLAISEAVCELARHEEVRWMAQALLGSECFVARALFFDKTPAANWKVVWHQDLTIAVSERRDVAGFGPWSIKAGVTHVQPPTDVLQRMLAVRVHLDDCTADNGPVRVLPGSHLVGKLTPDDIEEWKARVDSVDCLVKRGGLLAFRPLLLHASSAAKAPHRRRVVHFEFAAGELPGGLAWKKD